MIKRKRIMSLILALTVPMSLAACGKKTEAPTSTSTTPTANTETKIDTSKFVNVNYVVLGNKPTNGQFENAQAKWNEYLKEKVNANLDMKWVEWTDWYTKYNLLLASGEALDLITTASDWLDLWPNAQKGAFKNLDDLLPKYAPKTYASVSKQNWEQCKYNGKIVTMPEDNYTQWVNHGFLYRGDWAKEFGITSPIKDWDTMGKYLQGIKDKKPGVIPWSFAGGSYSSAFGWFQSKTKEINIDAVPTALGTSLYYGKSADDAYTVVSPYMEDTFVDYAKTMKKWGDAGYWRQDALNYKGDGWVEMKAGQTGTRQHHTQTFVGEYSNFEKAQPGADLQFFSFSDESNNLLEMPITHGATSIGTNSKNAERALMVYDLIRNDEKMYRYINYGLEGVQYVVKDGKLDRPASYDTTKNEFYTDFWGGRNDKLELPNVNLYPKYKDIYAAYDKIKKPYPYGRFVFNKQAVESEIAALSEVSSKYLPSIGLGKFDDPTKAVEEFRSKLKAAGFDKVKAEVQKQMDDYKKLVNTK
jgi:putative aldouronate transport system substrate-binding protein